MTTLLQARTTLISSSNEGMFLFSPQQISFIRRDVVLIAYHMIFLGILITLSVILILFSTARQRRSYLLALQVFSMSLVLSIEIIFVVYFFRDIANIIYNRGPTDPAVLSNTRLGLTVDALIGWAPLFSDSVLLYRVYEIHSPSLRANLIQRLRPILPLLILLCARIGLVGAAIEADLIDSRENITAYNSDISFRNWLKLRLADWCLQIIYCSYAFTVIMRQILRMVRGSNLLKRSSSIRTRSRLRFFLEAMLMTFLIPLICQIGGLITYALLYKYPDSITISTVWNRFVDLNYIFSSIFAILATSWSTIREVSHSVLTSRSRSHGSSLDQMHELQDLKSRAGSSVNVEDRGRSDEIPRRARSTLLERMFPNPQDMDDEDMEELRTTQFNVTYEASTPLPRQRFGASTSDNVATPEIERPRTAL